MLKLEARPQASNFWSYASPILALLITVVIGVALFMALGKDPVKGLQVFFWEPIKTPRALGELMVKATPLLVIALGLAVCFRSNVWNIGAEGQINAAKRLFPDIDFRRTSKCKNIDDNMCDAMLMAEYARRKNL